MKQHKEPTASRTSTLKIRTWAEATELSERYLEKSIAYVMERAIHELWEWERDKAEYKANARQNVVRLKEQAEKRRVEQLEKAQTLEQELTVKYEQQKPYLSSREIYNARRKIVGAQNRAKKLKVRIL